MTENKKCQNASSTHSSFQSCQRRTKRKEQSMRRIQRKILIEFDGKKQIFRKTKDILVIEFLLFGKILYFKILNFINWTEKVKFAEIVILFEFENNLVPLSWIHENCSLYNFLLAKSIDWKKEINCTVILMEILYDKTTRAVQTSKCGSEPNLNWTSVKVHWSKPNLKPNFRK